MPTSARTMNQACRSRVLVGALGFVVLGLAAAESTHAQQPAKPGTSTVLQASFGDQSPVINADGSVRVNYKNYIITLPPEKLTEIKDALSAQALEQRSYNDTLVSMLREAAHEEALSVVRTKHLMRWSGGVSIGLGTVATIVGAIFLVQMIEKNDDSQQFCDGSNCREPGYGFRQDAIAAGNAATGFFIGGGLGLAIGGALVLLAPDLQRAETSGDGALLRITW